jgi:hypothetical protein
MDADGPAVGSSLGCEEELGLPDGSEVGKSESDGLTDSFSVGGLDCEGFSENNALGTPDGIIDGFSLSLAALLPTTAATCFSLEPFAFLPKMIPNTIAVEARRRKGITRQAYLLFFVGTRGKVAGSWRSGFFVAFTTSTPSSRVMVVASTDPVSTISGSQR